jgi:hypothetical protein
MAGVVVGNVVGLGGNVAAAVYFEQSAGSYSAASAAYAANSTADGLNFGDRGSQQNHLAHSTLAVQLFCEVAVLLLIVVAFAVTGAACRRRFTSAQLDDTADGRQLWRQIVGTAGFVFVTFVLRAVYSTMHAVADGFQHYDICASGNPCDASCHNLYALMQTWLNFTPEIQLSVELISSPLTLLVALWGMTSKHTLRLMQSRRREMNNTMRIGMLQETGAA